MLKIVKKTKIDKEEKIREREFKKIAKIKEKKKDIYIKKSILKKKIANSQTFTNIKNINDNGVMELKDNQYAIFYRVQPIDLSLTNEHEQKVFYNTLSKLYRLPCTIKAYKFDEKINLNVNKENYDRLIKKNKNNKEKLELLTDNRNFIDVIEEDNVTTASSYYLCLISKNKESLEKNKEDFERLCLSVIPKLEVTQINNKKHLIMILSNMYYSDINLDQLMYYDLYELIVPLHISVQPSLLKIDDRDVQMLSIKNYPLFIDNGFLDKIVNIPKVKVSMTIKDTIEKSKLLSILNSSFKSVLADYNSSKNLSDVTNMKSLLDNYKLLIEQISSNDEKIKEVSLVLSIEGTKEERDEIINEIKLNADMYQIKVDIPKLRQMEAWQSYDVTDFTFKDYAMYLPTLTLSCGFPFSESYHNDTSGWLLGEDSGYGLPIFFDPFYLNNERTGHNMSVIGSTGSGKSFLARKIMINQLPTTKIFLFDIENEFHKLVERNGGEYIDLASKSLINPLQVRYIQTLSDDEDDLNNNILSKHLGFLENFFVTAFNDITEKELVVLLDIVEKFYNSRGISKTTTEEEFSKLKVTDYPIFTDLYNYLVKYQKKVKNPEESRILVNIEVLLKRMIIGQDAILFNGYTSIDLSNDLIAFNLQELTYNSSKRLINTQMLNVLTFLNQEIASNKRKNYRKKDKKNILIVVDEFHHFIDEDNPTLLRYFGQMCRRLRKYSAGMIILTQSPQDITSKNSILRHASAIFNNCQYQITGMLKDDDLTAVEKIYANNRLTETQKNFLTNCHQGQFLVNVTNKKRLRVNVIATILETYFMGESNLKNTEG